MNAIGSQGQKRPGNVIGCTVDVTKIATGEIEETLVRKRQPGKAVGGAIGDYRRAASFTPDRRSEIALIATKARWEE